MRPSLLHIYNMKAGFKVAQRFNFSTPVPFLPVSHSSHSVQSGGEKQWLGH